MAIEKALPEWPFQALERFWKKKGMKQEKRGTLTEKSALKNYVYSSKFTGGLPSTAANSLNTSKQ